MFCWRRAQHELTFGQRDWLNALSEKFPQYALSERLSKQLLERLERECGDIDTEELAQGKTESSSNMGNVEARAPSLPPSLSLSGGSLFSAPYCFAARSRALDTVATWPLTRPRP